MSGGKKKGVHVNPRLKSLVLDYCNSQENPQRVLVEDVVRYLKTYPEYSRNTNESLSPMTRKVLEQDTNLLNQNLHAAYAKLEPITPVAEKEEKDEGRAKKRSRVSQRTPTTSLTEGIAKALRAGFAPTSVPSFGYEVMGGLKEAIDSVHAALRGPFLCQEIYSTLNANYSPGILLYGPPGCGKTQLGNAIAGELGRSLAERGETLSFYKIAAPELISNMSGESESNVRALFELAKSEAPSLIFIDEIDVICPKRDTASKDMEKRIVAQLISSFDSLSEGNERVMVLGATNRVESLDPSLRRGGRFAKEIPLDVDRAEILKILIGKLKTTGNFDFLALARKTPGFVGADLNTLSAEAASIAVARILSEDEKFKKNLKTNSQTNEMDIEGSQEEEVQEDLQDKQKRFRVSPEVLATAAVTMEDFLLAIPKVQPSAQREGFATVPNVTWEEVGALEGVREELRQSILHPIQKPEDYRRVGLDSPAGVLLYGPPGCGKTLLAKAVANNCNASFISVKGPELFNKYVGESERAVRTVFERAKLSKPCIIFFDEVDALCPRRSGDGNEASKKVVNQLLTEMDGLEGRKDIFIIAATNRPDIIDPAILRPQRLDKLVYVPLPSPQDRIQILKKVSRKMSMDSSIDLEAIALRCERFSGADLYSLAREASIAALSRHLSSERSKEEDTTPINVLPQDWEVALKKTRPSVSEEVIVLARSFFRKSDSVRELSREKIFSNKF